MSQNPSLPINQASEDWHVAKAAYRFFSNNKVTPEKILSPHVDMTIERASKYNYFYVIQDTTVIDYTRHQKSSGLGCIGGQLSAKYKTHGMIMHTSLALSPSGVPLGIVSNYIWTRSQKKDGSRNFAIPTEYKENSKWINALEDYSKCFENKVPIITICDHEADFLDFFLVNEDLGGKFIVRSSHNRNQISHHKDKIYDEIIKTTPFDKLYNFKVPNKGSKPIDKRKRFSYKESSTYREISVRIYHQEVKLRPPEKSNGQLVEALTVQHIYMEEINPPSEEEKIHWHILTNLQAATVEECWNIIQAYKQRWKIELLFKSLKTGCKIEDCRLADGRKLMNFISLKLVTAWRIFWIKHLAEENPNLTCDFVLTDNEWHTLYKKIKKTNEMPRILPTTYEIVYWIGRLGGHLNRKSDGPPGLISLWRGWMRLQDMVTIQEINQKV